MGYFVITLAMLLGLNPEFSKKQNLRNVGLFLYSPFLNYTFRAQGEKDLEIAPTSSNIAGISLKQKDFTYTFGYQQKNENRSSEQETNFFDLQVAVDIEKLLVSAYYQNYQGFYLNQDGLININDRKDIRSVSYGLNLRYFTKEDYDLGKSLLSDKKNRESNYSFVHSAYLNSSKLTNNSQLFLTESFDALEDLEKFQVLNLGYEYGVTGTYHLAWMRLTGLFSLGYNLHHLYLDGREKDKAINGSVSASAFIDLGLIDTKTFTAGVFAKKVKMDFKHEEVEISQRRASINLYLRYFF